MRRLWMSLREDGRVCKDRVDQYGRYGRRTDQYGSGRPKSSSQDLLRGQKSCANIGHKNVRIRVWWYNPNKDLDHKAWEKKVCARSGCSSLLYIWPLEIYEEKEYSLRIRVVKETGWKGKVALPLQPYSLTISSWPWVQNEPISPIHSNQAPLPLQLAPEHPRPV